MMLGELIRSNDRCCLILSADVLPALGISIREVARRLGVSHYNLHCVMATGLEKQRRYASKTKCIGGLLFDASRVAQLIVSGNLERTGLLETLLESPLIGLNSFSKENFLKLPAGYRLAFRELGLSIGLHAVEKIRELIGQKSAPLRKKDSLLSLLKTLSRFAEVRETIERFWLEGINREAESWIAHHDINWVMLATSLAPNGFLEP